MKPISELKANLSKAAYELAEGLFKEAQKKDKLPSGVYLTVNDEMETGAIRAALKQAEQSKRLTAECLGIDRATLRTKMIRHNL